MPRTIAPQRVRQLNDLGPRGDGDYTLYWMQQSQRAQCNHALEFAVQRANRRGNRLLVCFGLAEDYPDANLRHFRFLVEGLQETEAALRRRGIPLALRLGDPAEVAIKLGRNATEVICDRGYLRHQRGWRRRLAESAGCTAWQVESDAIVPVETASDKAEYAARTIRPKLQRLADDYLQPLQTTPLEKHSLNLGVGGEDLGDLERLLSRMSVDRSVGPAPGFSGGASAGRQRLKQFLKSRLDTYDEGPSVVDPRCSQLSPWLHFGQISPLDVALAVRSARGRRTEAKRAFIDELLVRRELAINFVHYEDDYDSLKCVPQWAAKTMQEHQDDKREHHYTAAELEAAETHDAAWNAAMLEMKAAGYLHNHLRMYWGKKILQWTNTYRHAYKVALALNNRYFLDGRDASSYANIAWLFGLHDRAHQERPVFGKLRYMSRQGLHRKLDVDQYIRNVQDEWGVEVHGFDADG